MNDVIFSLIKVGIFVVLAAALAFGLMYIQDTPGQIQIAFGGQELQLTPLKFLLLLLVAFAAFWILLKLAGLILAIIRTLMGEKTALNRYFDKNRERKGYAALSDAMIALASGEGPKAVARAAKAEKLLHKPELTRLLTAQAAEMTGDRIKAIELYKQLLGNDRTRFIGVKGLMNAKLEEGDTERALKLAEKAFALKPGHNAVQDTLFALQSEAEDWAGARRTLNAKARAKTLPKDVVRRRDAVLSVADAMTYHKAGNIGAARDAALMANRNAPALVPGAVLAAQVYTSEGTPRNAVRVLNKAWEANPHPDLAAAYAAIAPDETPAERLTRFAPFLRLKPDHPETRLLETELHLAAEDFPAARRALGDLAEKNPTARTLALMAAVTRGEGAPEEVVRGWLARALTAPRGEQWVCSACHSIHPIWSPTCSNCEAFDTLSWALPAETEHAGLSEAMLPLLMRNEPEQPPEDEPAKEPDNAPSPDEDDPQDDDSTPVAKQDLPS